MSSQMQPGVRASADREEVRLSSASDGCNDTGPHVGKHKIISADDSQKRTSSPSPTMYKDRHETAIALVDLNQKRLKRKSGEQVESESYSRKLISSMKYHNYIVLW